MKGILKSNPLHTTIRAAVVAGLVMVAGASAAKADGWIAQNIIKPVFGDHAAREADKLHAQMGNPLDHAANVAAGVAADAVVPGAGTVVTTGLEARDAARKN